MINVIENFEINNQLINWEKLKLGDYINLLTGYPFKSKLFNTDGEGKPLIRNRNINNQIPDLYTTEEYDQSYVISSGDILITMDGDFNIAKWSGVESLLNQRVLKINSYDKEIIEQVYLLYSLEEYLTFIHKRTSGTTVKHLKKSDIENLIVPIPPVKEQQKIAEILSTIDGQIEQTNQLIEKTKELKKGLMQQLLTKGIGHTEFKQSEFGEIPADWRIDQIGNVTEYVDYRGKTPKKTDEGVLLITAKNIKKGYIDYSVSKEYIDKDDYSNVMRRGKAYLGEVLFTTEAPLGNVAQVNNEKIALAQRVIKFNGNNSLNNTFLKYYLLSDIFQKKLISLATGSTVLGIQGKRLHKINILIPNLIEQQKIADILSSVDEDIEGYEEEKEKYEEMKKGLMQQLLTGKTRVKVD